MDWRAIKSVRSLLAANLTQPEISCLESQDFLGTLPTEMFRSILVRVQTLELIPLRLVSNRWKVAIESICSDKKCLVVMHKPNKYYLPELLKRFNLYELSKDSVVFKLKSHQRDFNLHPNKIHLSGLFCTLLVKLFPRLEQLYIIDKFSHSSPEFNSMLQQWSSSLTALSVNLHFYEDVNNLCTQINQLTNLIQLNLDTPSVSANQLAPTLARLEHLSGSGLESLDKIAPYLGARISSLGFIGSRGVNLEELTNWHQLNSRSVSNLVRFAFYIGASEIFPFICKHFSSLQVLRINKFIGLELTTGIIGHLTRLTHLSDLQINCLYIDLASLDVINLKPLSNIRMLTLGDLFINDNDDGEDGEKYFDFDLPENAFPLCRLLSIIFPNVETFIIENIEDLQFGNALEPHVKLFANLRSHNFTSK